MLTLSERVVLVVHCGDHLAAVCPQCSETVSFDKIGTNVVASIPDFCPGCNTDLTARFRRHLAECTWIRLQVRAARASAQAKREGARETARASKQLRDRADLLGREAEARGTGAGK
jgi:hypothetical protein